MQETLRHLPQTRIGMRLDPRRAYAIKLKHTVG